MKALVYEGPRQMPLREVSDPTPGPEDVIVAVKAVGICGSDVHGYMGLTGRRTPPMIMGHEFGGVVSAVGANVTRARAGESVVVQPLLSCGQCVNCRAGLQNICLQRSGLGMLRRNGAMAEAVCVPQQLLHSIPAGMRWEQSALVEPLAVALHAVNLTPLPLMETVVVVGAGTIGLLTVLAAQLAGAGLIIATDVKPRRLELARRLGAGVVVNAAEEDARAVVERHTGGHGAPAVIEAVGTRASATQALSLVRTGGHVTWIGNSQPVVEVNMQQVVTREVTIRGSYGFNEEFERAIQAIHSRRVDIDPLIECLAPLADGPRLMEALADGSLDAAKVVLQP